MKRWILATAMAAGSVLYAEGSDDAILKQLQAIQAQLQQQQLEIENLKAQLSTQATTSHEEVNRLVKTQVQSELATAIENRGLAEKKDLDSLLTVGKNVDNLTLNGDLRLRYEYRNTDGYAAGFDKLLAMSYGGNKISDIIADFDADNPMDVAMLQSLLDDPGFQDYLAEGLAGTEDDVKKERFRTRFRLGFTWRNSTENWEIGAGLATGSDDPLSTNDTWGENNAFETGDIRLDYAYAKHTWKDYGLSLTLGQQKNPFESHWIMWDSDVRPTGATLKYGCNGLFATLGAYNVRYVGTDRSLANMYAGQVGYKFKAENGLQAMITAAYYSYDNQVSDIYGLSEEDYNLSIGDLYGHLAGKMGGVNLKGYGQVAMNFGADDSSSQLFGGAVPGDFLNAMGYNADDQNLAWVLGLEAKTHGWTLGYAYAYIEGDSVPYFLTDSDFGAGLFWEQTNVQGHEIALSYALTKHCKIGAEAHFYTPIDDLGMDFYGDQTGQLYQFDLSYKF